MYRALRRALFLVPPERIHHLVFAALRAGARGYVLKEDIPGILDAVKQVLRGGTFISKAVRPK
jgi:dihydroorotate dehydrogenase